MTVYIYRNATTGSTNGTLEVPGDGVGTAIGQVGSVATIHLRCAAGFQTAETVTVNAPLDCQVSKDGMSYGDTAVYTAGQIGPTNVVCYIKRTGIESVGVITAPLTPRAALVSVEAV
jgi:hypothetical protein